MEVINEVFLSLGSNVGERKDNLNNAIQLLSTVGTVIKQSKIYVTPPFGFQADTDFLNMCLQFHTNISPQELLNKCNEIEVSLGRIRNEGSYQSRTIDIDIIFFDKLVLHTGNLQIPHPAYKKRKFVLIPLLDLDKNLSDPITGENIELLLDNCTDESDIKEYIFEN